MGQWVMMGQWVRMGQWVMGHVYDGSDGSWVTKSDPWSTLMNSRTSLRRTPADRPNLFALS